MEVWVSGNVVSGFKLARVHGVTKPAWHIKVLAYACSMASAWDTEHSRKGIDIDYRF